MADDEEEVFYECIVCEGEKGRCRRSDGSSICKHDSCYRELRRRRAAGSDEVERTALAWPAKAARTSIFKIREVLGIDLCVAADDRQKRAGRAADDDNISYKVRGGFGEDKDDELIPDTRWVTLGQLTANMSESQLAALDTWASKLHKTAKEARKRKRREQESGE